MKTKILNLTIALFLMASFSALGQETKTEKIKVFGSCGMCENRIEKTVSDIEGVTSADWNKETKMLEVSFDSEKVKIEDIHKTVAKVGHDTEKEKASDEVYNALAGCCQYERESK